MQRRTFLTSLNAMLAWQALRSVNILGETSHSFVENPFQLGVASGDPAPDGIVLWTRLAPEITSADFGLPPRPIDVRWEIAHDEAMRKIAQKGRVAATPELNHSVHVEVFGLQPGRQYFYRFYAGGASSEVGRTKTAPSHDTGIDKVRFAFASCQHYDQGFYVAHRDMAQADLDAVVFLGDYIYEHHNPNVINVRHTEDTTDIVTLAQYRQHYAEYKADPYLRACHQAHPWIVTLDDHEVSNDWAGDTSRIKQWTREQFLIRRAAAFQAYYENMPLRSLCVPHGSHMQLYRTVPYGKLVQFTVLDTRQFRTPQPCDDRPTVNCQGRFDERATMMGAAQEAWFQRALSESSAQWNVIANQVMIAQARRTSPEGNLYPLDSWDGYVAARKRMTGFLAAAKPRNPFFVTGDAHHTFVSDLKTDFDRPSAEVVASEIVGTSISTGGDGRDRMPRSDEFLAANPHVKYENGQRGYLICEADSKRMLSELRVARKVTDQDGAVLPVASFVVESDRKGIQQVSGPSEI